VNLIALALRSRILGYIEGIGVLAIAGVIAYIDPETTGIKLGIIASGAVLAMVLIGVI
jgi:hypothetical protein